MHFDLGEDGGLLTFDGVGGLDFLYKEDWMLWTSSLTDTTGALGNYNAAVVRN